METITSRQSVAGLLGEVAFLVPCVLPHVLADGTLVIPFDSPQRFHWWNGGQTISETGLELGEEEQ